MSNSKIFNVEEATGKDCSAFETTAAEAQVNAPNAQIARQIEANAEREKSVAQQAATAAKSLGEEYTGESMTATDKLQKDASKTTNAAVSKGKNNVDHVKAVGADYVEQVKGLARSAIETAQTYLPTSVANQLPNFSEGTTTNTESQPFSDKLQREASKATNAAVSEGKNSVDHAKTVGAEYVEQVKGLGRSAIETAQTYLPASVANQLPNLSDGTTKNKESQPSSDIPATSAPLESGPHIVSSPYSSTTKDANVGANEAPKIHN